MTQITKDIFIDCILHKIDKCLANIRSKKEPDINSAVLKQYAEALNIAINFKVEKR